MSDLAAGIPLDWRKARALAIRPAFKGDPVNRIETAVRERAAFLSR